MKTFRTHLRSMALIFATLILLQGCTVYRSANVTLEEASRAETVVRVTTNENKKIKYDRIGFENDHYYGLNYKTGDDLKVRLDENNINKIQVKDKTGSVLLSLSPIVIIGAIVGIAVASGNCCGY